MNNELKGKLIKQIMMDRNCNESMAKIHADSFDNLDKKLMPVLLKWLENREVINFKFEDISINEIIERSHTDIYGAIVNMNFLIHRPDMISKYKKINFRIK